MANMHDIMIKSLRKDARRLETVARHLRDEAKRLAFEQRALDRAEKARAGFLAKKSIVDNSTIIEPILNNEKGETFSEKINFDYVRAQCSSPETKIF